MYVPIFITKTTIKGCGLVIVLSNNHDGTTNGMDVSMSWDSGSIDETTDYPLIAVFPIPSLPELIHRTLLDNNQWFFRCDWNAVENPLLAVGIDTSQLNQLLKEQILQDEQNRSEKDESNDAGCLMLKSISMTAALPMFHFGQFIIDINKGSIVQW